MGADLLNMIGVPGLNYRGELGDSADGKRRGASGDFGGIEADGDGCRISTRCPPESVGASGRKSASVSMIGGTCVFWTGWTTGRGGMSLAPRDRR